MIGGDQQCWSSLWPECADSQSERTGFEVGAIRCCLLVCFCLVWAAPTHRLLPRMFGKTLSKVCELTGRKNLRDLFRDGMGVWVLLDGNLFIQLFEQGPKGNLVGTDDFGNKYYENKDLPYTRSRWVIYGDKWNYNASSIPPNWHGWVNYINDYPPTTYDYKPPIYQVAPYITRTGTPIAYNPKGAWSNPEKRSWKKYETWQPSQQS